MNKLNEFMKYLTTDFISRNGKPCSNKVASDYRSRLRAIDAVFEGGLSDDDILNENDFNMVLTNVKESFSGRKTASTTNPYPYSAHFMALRRYRDFLKKHK